MSVNDNIRPSANTATNDYLEILPNLILIELGLLATVSIDTASDLEVVENNLQLNQQH